MGSCTRAGVRQQLLQSRCGLPIRGGGQPRRFRPGDTPAIRHPRRRTAPHPHPRREYPPPRGLAFQQSRDSPDRNQPPTAFHRGRRRDGPMAGSARYPRHQHAPFARIESEDLEFSGVRGLGTGRKQNRAPSGKPLRIPEAPAGRRCRDGLAAAAGCRHPQQTGCGRSDDNRPILAPSGAARQVERQLAQCLRRAARKKHFLQRRANRVAKPLTVRREEHIRTRVCVSNGRGLELVQITTVEPENTARLQAR